MKHVDDKIYTDDNVELKFRDVYHLIELSKDNTITGKIITDTVGSAFPYPLYYVCFSDLNIALDYIQKHRLQNIENVLTVEIEELTKRRDWFKSVRQ